MWDEHNRNSFSDYEEQAKNNNKKSKSKGYKIGGKVTKDRALAVNVDGESDAVLIKAHTDEMILPKDSPKRALDLMAEYINGSTPLSNMINQPYSNESIVPSSIQNTMFNLGTSGLEKYERISNMGGDTKIENIFNVQGNMDKSIIPEISKMIDRKFHDNARKQVSVITSYGGKLNAAKRGF